MKLPYMPNADRIRKHQTIKFAGYDHNKSAMDGAIWDMENMSSVHYPLLSTREKRHVLRSVSAPKGLYAHDGLYMLDGKNLIKVGKTATEDKLILTLTDSKKVMCAIGPYLVVFPDKVFYNVEKNTTGTLEATYKGSATISDGTYAGESAKANTLKLSGLTDAKTLFSVGDAVSISGFPTTPNNTTAIIREIDGNNLRFYENTFEIKTSVTASSATVKREVPDLDFMCVNENRIWGCKGDTIYASKLGDPLNWNVFDGLSTDSYAVDVGSSGDFTACCSYLGYPCFFKEEHIYKVYGSKPSNYQVMGSASLGVAKGEGQSVAVAGEVLFYLSRIGFIAYSGGIPQSVHAAFGTENYHGAVGGSDGRRYYVSCKDSEGSGHVFAYDTEVNAWHREDSAEWMATASEGGMFVLSKTGGLYYVGDPNRCEYTATEEGAFDSAVEFGDFVEGDPNRKGSSKFQIRIELEKESSVTLQVQFDSSGKWEEAARLTADKKRSYYVPIIPRRSDHFKIRILGRGEWVLYSLVRESYSGSEL